MCPSLPHSAGMRLSVAIDGASAGPSVVNIESPRFVLGLDKLVLLADEVSGVLHDSRISNGAGF